MTAPKKYQRSSLWRGLCDLYYATPLYALTLRGPTPKALRALPIDPWPGDMKAAETILGVGVDFSNVENKDEALAPHDFNWLSNLRKLGSQAAQAKAQALVAQWINRHGSWNKATWRGDILGSRLSQWLTAQEFLLAKREASFKDIFLKSLSVQARHLRQIAPASPKDFRAFPAIKGLIHCGICLPENRGSLDTGLRLLGREIERQILPDGGHFQRNPSLLLSVMSHLVEIQGALHSAQTEVPPFLQGAMDRMAPMLRGLRMGDGGLCLFNGGKEESRKLIDTVLVQSGAKGKALTNAPHTGFQRMNAGRTTLVIDTGSPEAAHAGALSFELSSGKARLIVNCGPPTSNNQAWHQAARATAAHSTISVEDANSCDFLHPRSPQKTLCQRREASGNMWLETHHDGYKKAFGLTHERNFYLDSSGADLRGEDILTGFGGKNFVARFHLHPRIQAYLAEDGVSVLLKPPTGPGWRFRASGGTVALEESIYMGQDGPPRRSEQITVSGPLNGAGAHLKWSLRREDKRN